MSRYAFRLKIKPDKVAEYEEAHRNVWPELRAVIKNAGITDYSIFRHGTDLFFYLRADDFHRAWAEVEQSSVNSSWQDMMAPLFDVSQAADDNERFPMMSEVFFLE